MVSRLERLAEYYRAHGFVDEATLLENQAIVFRKAGMPEDFPQEAASTEPPLEDSTNEFHDLRFIRAKLIEALSVQQGESGKPVLTGELASSINMGIGQYLEDDLRIEDLILPSSKTVTNKYWRNKQRAFSIEGFERLEQVNLQVKIAYNRALKTLSRRGYKSVGEIRNADPLGMFQKRNIGKPTLNFVKTAFARPQTGK